MMKFALAQSHFRTLSRKQLRFTIISGIIATGLLLLYFFDPATSRMFPPSPFRVLTGLFCPGCGTLRGLHQLLHGNLLGAFGFNPLMVISLPFMVYSYLAFASDVLLGQRLPKVYIEAKWIWRLLYVILAYWLLRNLSIAPFSWLAP